MTARTKSHEVLTRTTVQILKMLANDKGKKKSKQVPVASEPVVHREGTGGSMADIPTPLAVRLEQLEGLYKKQGEFVKVLSLKVERAKESYENRSNTKRDKLPPRADDTIPASTDNVEAGVSNKKTVNNVAPVFIGGYFPGDLVRCVDWHQWAVKTNQFITLLTDASGKVDETLKGLKVNNTKVHAALTSNETDICTLKTGLKLLREEVERGVNRRSRAILAQLRAVLIKTLSTPTELKPGTVYTPAKSFKIDRKETSTVPCGLTELREFVGYLLEVGGRTVDISIPKNTLKNDKSMTITLSVGTFGDLCFLLSIATQDRLKLAVKVSKDINDNPFNVVLLASHHTLPNTGKDTQRVILCGRGRFTPTSPLHQENANTSELHTLWQESLKHGHSAFNKPITTKVFDMGNERIQELLRKDLPFKIQLIWKRRSSIAYKTGMAPAQLLGDIRISVPIVDIRARRLVHDVVTAIELPQIMDAINVPSLDI